MTLLQVFERYLKESLATFNVSDADYQRLVTHWQLVKEWNQRTDLTAIEEDQNAAWLHYRDSLEALTLDFTGPVLDAGSGAGFPGIPLAILRPNIPFTLLEPKRKRVSFLRVAATECRITNCSFLTQRIEDSPRPDFATIVTRATFSETRLFAAMAWLKPGGRLVAWRSDVLQSAHPSLEHWYEILGRRRLLQIWTKDT